MRLASSLPHLAVTCAGSKFPEALMRHALALLALLVPMTAAFAQDAAQILSDRVERDQQGVGIVAATIENDTPVFTSIGMADANGETPVDETTLFEIGSISKLFGSLLLAQMVLDGTMELEAPVANYLPEGTKLPQFEGQPITLFDLATHSAGLPSIPPDLGTADPLNPYAGYGAEPFYAFLAEFTLPHAPGTEFEYSNTGAVLLAEAISHTAGKPYAELVRERILDPLGMTDTSLEASDPLRLAGGHDRAGNPVPHWEFDIFAPAGGFISTAADLAKFAAAASGQHASPLDAAFALMLEDTRPAGSPRMSIGLGWMLLQHDNGTTVWHNGITGGFNSFIGFDRETRKAVVVLANSVTQTGIEDIGFHLIDENAALAPQPQPREAIEIDPALLQDFVGTYELGPEFSIAVTAEDGQLFIQASGQQRLEAFPESQTKFFLRQVDAQISFERSEDGTVTGLVLHQNGQDIPGRKK